MKHDFPFDPTYGYTIETLLNVSAPDGPADFADFWRRTYDQAMRVPLEVSRKQIASPSPGVEVFEIEYNSLDGFRIGAWLTVPAESPVCHGLVVGHGYGSREGPDMGLPGPPAAAIFPCARGLGRSRRPDVPDDPRRHVVHGIESREAYVHRGCVADLWCGVSALIQTVPEVAKNVAYVGVSFGGGIGAMAVPWDPRITRAVLGLPSFGDHPLRVTLPCVGSGESVRLLHGRRPEVLDVLAYFDAATAARHIRVPTLVEAALFDPAVPPPGQFAVFNALPGEKELVVRQAAHFGPYEGSEQEDRRIREASHAWLSR